MPQKSKTKTTGNLDPGRSPISEMADQTRKQYEQAIRAGQRFQEGAGQWWSRVLNQGAAAEWQKHVANFASLASNMMPLAQRRMEDVMSLMEKNSKASADLMRKAVDAAQTPVIAESQAKWFEFWTSSVRTMQSNVEAVTELSTRAIDSWVDFVRKNTEITEVRVPKAA
jgi:hypothetical protein